MTTIAARVYDDRVVVAADSQVTCGELRLPVRAEKVWFVRHREGHALLAAAGDYRTLQVAKQFELPAHPPTLSAEAWVGTCLVPAWFKWKEACGISTSDETDLLGAFGWGLVEICSDGAVVDYPDGVAALGSGMAYALGALEAGADPVNAVKIAAHFDIGTGGFFHERTLICRTRQT